MKNGLIYDLEVLPNLTLFCGKRQSNGELYTFSKFNDEVVDGDVDELRDIVKGSTLIGYNSHSYDDPILRAILNDASNEEVFELSKQRIGERVKREPLNSGACVGSIDLSHLVRIGQRIPALKGIGAVLRYPVIGNLPVDPLKAVNDEEFRTLKEYCAHDVGITEALLEHQRPAYQMRAALAQEFDITDPLNLSDSQLGERVILNQYLAKSHSGYEQVRSSTLADAKEINYSYKCPASIKEAAKDTPVIAELIKRREDHQFKVIPLHTDGKKIVNNHHVNDLKIIETIGGRKLEMAGGGAHSIDGIKGLDLIGEVKPTSGESLFELDVSSMYPSIIIEHDICPGHLKPEAFKSVYTSLRDSRIEAKLAGDYAKADGLKISLNAIYGKLQSRFSPFYDPRALTSVVTTGQIAIALLTQWLADAGAKIVTVNTDAVTVLSKVDVSDIVARWENATGLTLDRTDFDWMLLNDVSNRAYKKTGGGLKFKGEWLAPNRAGAWLTDSISQKAVIDAVSKFSDRGDRLKYVEEFIRSRKDIRDFLTSEKVNKLHQKSLGDVALEKNTRLYHSTEGSPIVSLYKGKDASDAKETVERYRAMPELKDIPDDLDYQFYIKQARDLLLKIHDWDGNFNAEANDLIQRGIIPMPLDSNGHNFKGQSGQLRTAIKNIDYSIAGSLGAYTGVHANSVIAIDVDEPHNIPQEIRQALADSGGLFCWSTNEGDTPRTLEEVKAGLIEGSMTGKAKVLYKATFKSNLSGTLRLKSHVGSYGKRSLFDGGLEVFFGEKISILGTSLRDDGKRKRFYTLSEGDVTALPSEIESLVIDQWQKKALEERIDEAPVKRGQTLNAESSTQLQLFMQSEGMEAISVNEKGVKGRCIHKSHGNFNRSEYFVGVEANGSLYDWCVKCKKNAPPITELNERWKQFERRVTLPPLEEVKDLPIAAERTAELILSDTQNIVIQAPMRSGKTSGMAKAAAMNHGRDTLMIMCLAHKSAMLDFTDQLKAVYGRTVEDLDGIILNAESPLPSNADSKNLIVTHHTYLTFDGVLGNVYGLIKLAAKRKSSGREVVFVIDEGDQCIEQLRKEIQIGVRTTGATENIAVKCPSQFGNGSCQGCKFNPNTTYLTYQQGKGGFKFVNEYVNKSNRNNNQRERYNEDARLSPDVLNQLTLSEPRQVGISRSHRIMKDSVKAADLYAVNHVRDEVFTTPEEAFFEMLDSLDQPTYEYSTPILKETGEALDPATIGNGEGMVSTDLVQFPYYACNVPKIAGLQTGIFKALNKSGLKVRFLSATFDAEVKKRLCEIYGDSLSFEKLEFEKPPVDELLIAVALDKHDLLLRQQVKTGPLSPTEEVISTFAPHGLVVNYANYRDYEGDSWHSKQSTLNTGRCRDFSGRLIGRDGTVTGINDQFTHRKDEIHFMLTHVSGSKTRGKDFEDFKVAIVPMEENTPTSLYSNSDTVEDVKNEKRNRIETRTIQASGRILKVYKTEKESQEVVRRVLILTKIPEMFRDGDVLNLTELTENFSMYASTIKLVPFEAENYLSAFAKAADDFLKGISPMPDPEDFKDIQKSPKKMEKMETLFNLICENLRGGATWSKVKKVTNFNRSLKRIGVSPEKINEGMKIHEIKGDKEEMIKFIEVSMFGEDQEDNQ
ncbi:hypothetical protein OAI08_05850 [Gammaproteobacteria bacterium]|nr:hypothetical protein [Gammaproteobacteria bacterium]